MRLDQSDANYVDVIHSNGESLIVGGFGTWEPIGHVDFYPNGGRAQRGCQHLLIGGLYDFIYCKACMQLKLGKSNHPIEIAILSTQQWQNLIW